MPVKKKKKKTRKKKVTAQQQMWSRIKPFIGYIPLILGLVAFSLKLHKDSINTQTMLTTNSTNIEWIRSTINDRMPTLEKQGRGFYVTLYRQHEEIAELRTKVEMLEKQINK